MCRQLVCCTTRVHNMTVCVPATFPSSTYRCSPCCLRPTRASCCPPTPARAHAQYNSRRQILVSSHRGRTRVGHSGQWRTCLKEPGICSHLSDSLSRRKVNLSLLMAHKVPSAPQETSFICSDPVETMQQLAHGLSGAARGCVSCDIPGILIQALPSHVAILDCLSADVGSFSSSITAHTSRSLPTATWSTENGEGMLCHVCLSPSHR